jgi:hypothetical protein
MAPNIDNEINYIILKLPITLETRGVRGLSLCCFHPDPLTTMAAISNSCFWLVGFFKSSSLKLLSQMN